MWAHLYGHLSLCVTHSHTELWRATTKPAVSQFSSYTGLTLLCDLGSSFSSLALSFLSSYMGDNSCQAGMQVCKVLSTLWAPNS